jgi:hypothetical protein
VPRARLYWSPSDSCLALCSDQWLRVIALGSAHPMFASVRAERGVFAAWQPTASGRR